MRYLTASLICLLPCALTGQDLAWAESLVQDVRKASYPELEKKNVVVRPLHSDSDYFQARFSVPRFFFARMRYIVYANPNVTAAPPDGTRAIVAHELAHVLYYSQRKRIRLLGLVRLLSPASNARFERQTDIRAIDRGYGEGLKSFRAWVYQHVPPEKLAAKKRNYLTPEEITARCGGICPPPKNNRQEIK